MGREAVAALGIKPGGVYVDGTLGGGGHSRLILSNLGEAGRLIALDQDPEARFWALEGWGRGEGRLTVAAANFENLGETLDGLGIGGVDGVLLDLGLSSRQLTGPGRGFSWTIDEALDMRLDPDGDLTAYEVVNEYPEKELADVIWRYGEERASRRIARFLARARSAAPVATTGQLAALVAKALYRPGPPPRIHPATRTFMALRIEVNRELAVLENFLRSAPKLLNPGGRLVIISFHSLEDRLAKEAFREKDGEGRPVWNPLYKKPLQPGDEECGVNPRARSAKLRAAEIYTGTEAHETSRLKSEGRSFGE
jgi:16S rRNA (cytosine1402-N4)-methyltransferase